MPHRTEPLAPAPRPERGLERRPAWLGLAALAVALGVALALTLAFWMGGRFAAPAAPKAAAAPDTRAVRLAEVQAALAAERTAREELALQLAALEARTEALAAQLAARPLAEAEAEGAPEPAAREEDAAEAPASAPRPPLFDVEALVTGCMPRGEAEALRTRWERYELDRLELNDRAMRESFFMRPRHRNQHALLDAAFRRDVGDDGYDAFLRATGKPNRVTVREILPSGAGSAAGLEVGDEIERYAGVRVFSSTDLQRLTASGRLGETIDVEVLRGGEPLRLRTTRGPLGVVLEGAVRAPEGGC